MRVAAIDCGTNSIRLLIADLTAAEGGGHHLTDVVREMEVVRLGYGVDKTGVIAPEAMARTLAKTRAYAARCREHGVDRIRFVATSASRDARNADEFVAGVRAAFGDADVSPEVVSGDAEAQLSFSGATGDLIAAGIPGPYLVVDIGGGSTELVRGTDRVDAGVSVDVGCVRITERHLLTDPPTAAEVAAARADVCAVLAGAVEQVPLDGIRTVVGLAGSITTVTAEVLGLQTYDPETIHLGRGTLTDHLAACDRLLTASRDERAERGFMHPGRVDVIGAGALVWSEVLALVGEHSPGAVVVTSEHDILDGIALGLAH